MIANRANRQCNMNMDVILTCDFRGKEPKETFPPVCDKLAVIVTDWMQTTQKHEKIHELFRDTLIPPPHVEGLAPVQINEILYQKLPFKAKINDQRLRGIKTYFCSGHWPFVIST